MLIPVKLFFDWQWGLKSIPQNVHIKVIQWQSLKSYSNWSFVDKKYFQTETVNGKGHGEITFVPEQV